MEPKSFWNLRNRHPNTTLVRRIQGLYHGCLTMLISRVIRWNCSNQIFHFIVAYIKRIRFTKWIIPAGLITNDGSLECIILHNALCGTHAGETVNCKPCYNICFNHAMLGMAEHPEIGTGFWTETNESAARCILVEKPRLLYHLIARHSNKIQWKNEQIPPKATILHSHFFLFPACNSAPNFDW